MSKQSEPLIKIRNLTIRIPIFSRSNKSIKRKILSLQKHQAHIDEFQLYFIQMKNLFVKKIKSGDLNFSSKEYQKSLSEFDNLKKERNDQRRVGRH